MNAVSFAVAAAVLAVAPAMAAPADPPSLAVAQCVVDNDPESVAELLATLPGSQVEQDAAKSVLELYGPCQDNNLVAGGTIAWRERAELAFVAARTQLAKGRAAQAGVSWTPPSTASSAASTGYDPRLVGLLNFGACVTRATPEGAIGLVGSAPKSAEERAAIRLIKPVVGGCLPKGQEIKLDIADLRMMLAEPVYHTLTGR